MIDEELSGRIHKFACALVERLLDLKKDADAECEHLRESREPAHPFPRDPDIGLSCIESAAHDAEWFTMEGLAVAVQKSISLRDSFSLENWAGHEAQRIAKDREKREAAKRRRLEKDAAQAAKEQPS